jgi:GntR family transcriptional regulator
MLFRLDPASTVGLAEQIAGQVRGALGSGELAPGERLPAARDLAAGLDVNMHTVLRAYSALRDEGLVELRRGRGAQIRTDLDPVELQLADQIRLLVRAADRLGITREQLAEQVLHTRTGTKGTR